MDTQLVSPNLHVILIHYPLALLTAGVLIELFSFLWRHGTFRTAGRWMILLGALAAVPAAFAGIFALSDIAHQNNPSASGPWVDVKTTSPLLSQPQTWQVLRNHALYQAIAVGIIVLAVIFWLACSDHARKSLHLPLMVLLLLGMAVMIRAAQLGGDSVYLHGAGVDISRPKAEGEAAKEPEHVHYAFERHIRPVELHVIAAGVAVALALVSIGLSIRRITATVEITDTRPIIPTGETMAGDAPRTPPTPVAMVRSFNPGIEVMLPPFAPSGRFWMLTFVAALLTLLGGWFVIAVDGDVVSLAKQMHQPIPRAAWKILVDEVDLKSHKVTRALAHVVTGTLIVITPLVLACLARFAPRRRFWLGLFTLILAIAVTAQIWFGILLLYDTPEGPIAHFRASEMTAASAER